MMTSSFFTKKFWANNRDSTLMKSASIGIPLNKKLLSVILTQLWASERRPRHRAHSSVACKWPVYAPEEAAKSPPGNAEHRAMHSPLEMPEEQNLHRCGNWDDWDFDRIKFDKAVLGHSTSKGGGIEENSQWTEARMTPERLWPQVQFSFPSYTL